MGGEVLDMPPIRGVHRVYTLSVDSISQPCPDLFVCDGLGMKRKGLGTRLSISNLCQIQTVN